eukprot:TRINITY_DN28095_c0_g3_i2.p1 TRINITY_DN28095_c0_g3~~TRINITY_DN28095_c0_g3_i2.p1  ORF type:complete len:373 (-),score=50.22 TRINITY_DN28095_c0_g3_i2:130-1152(-)
MVERDRDNDELTYTLRSIAKNAPWVHKIFVLQNPECEDVWKTKMVAEPEKTVWINRCSLLPSESCPTRNSFAVQSVLHKIPGLSEHFIYTDDDNLLIHSTTASTFFKNSNGAWFPKVPKYKGAGATYENIAAVPLSEQQMPMRVLWSHCFQPLLKSVVAKFDNSYKEFVNLVRSHRTGRYSSALNQYGTTASEQANSIEEDFQGIWWWWLHENRMGSEISSDDYLDRLLFSDSRLSDWKYWYGLINEPDRVILNINDDLDSEDSVYQGQHQDAIQKLDEAFPAAQQQHSIQRSENASSFVEGLDKVVAPPSRRAILESAFPAPSSENFMHNFWGGVNSRH